VPRLPQALLPLYDTGAGSIIGGPHLFHRCTASDARNDLRNDRSLHSPQIQASSQEVTEAISKIKTSGLPVIFQEAGTNSKHVKEIIRDTGVKKGGELIADGNGTGERLGFVASFRHNINTLVAGLKQ
jgi:Zinc-uptake complex component A periplasmic